MDLNIKESFEVDRSVSYVGVIVFILTFIFWLGGNIGYYNKLGEYKFYFETFSSLLGLYVIITFFYTKYLNFRDFCKYVILTYGLNIFLNGVFIYLFHTFKLPINSMLLVLFLLKTVSCVMSFNYINYNSFLNHTMSK